MLSDKSLARVRNLLKGLEFCKSEGDHCSVCPSCNECEHAHRGRSGHGDGCELAAVLALVEAEIPKRAV